MEFIAHRINTCKQLQQLSAEYGVELDLRDGLDGRVYIEHNPFTPGEDFEEYLKEYHHGTIILNIKSERIESEVDKLLKKYKIHDYFYLDSSFPMIKLLTDQGEQNVALRFSEYEGLDTIENMKGKANWIWVDCFTTFPLNKEIEEVMHRWGYKICIVSPELQGQPEKIPIYAKQIAAHNLVIDAVCTKSYHIDSWKELFCKFEKKY